MSSTPSDDDRDRNMESMHEQLRKDVRSWSASRTEESTRAAEEFRVPVTQPAKRTASARPKPSPQPDPEVKPTAKAKKPFSMSYDGVTTADHIAYRISRGAR